jgi:hypothetical protein
MEMHLTVIHENQSLKLVATEVFDAEASSVRDLKARIELDIIFDRLSREAGSVLSKKWMGSLL